MTDLTKKVLDFCEKENASFAEVEKMTSEIKWEFQAILNKIENETKFTQA